MQLNHEEWEKINKAILSFQVPLDETFLRKKILEAVKTVIPFDLGGFCYALARDRQEPKIVDYILVSRYPRQFLKEFQYMYDNKYGKHDYTKWLFGSKESIVCRESDIISGAAKEKTAFYIDFLKPRNLLYCMDCYIVKAEHKPGILYFYRDNVLGDFTDKEVFILNILMPHIESRMLLRSIDSGSEEKYDRFAIYLKQTYNLTWREIEIAKMIKDGNTNKEISEALFIHTSTVKKHVTHILNKTDMDNRLKLMKLLESSESEF